VGTPTSGFLVNLVLDEEIDHRDDGSKEPKLDYEGLNEYQAEPTNAVAMYFLFYVSVVGGS